MSSVDSKTRNSESRIRDIRIDQIDRSRNHRIAQAGDADRIALLKASIDACGQLQPVRVYERGPDQNDEKHNEPYILGFGARRCAAMLKLDRKTIRAVVFPSASDLEIEQARAVENLHRQDITPLEEVQAVASVLEAIKGDSKFTGDAHEEAATRLARSVAWIKDRDYLHRLTKPVQQFAMRAAIPAGHLRELAKVGDSTEQFRLACESVGAPSWVFVPREGRDEVTEHDQKTQEEWFTELAGGKLTRVPLSKLKAEIAKVALSLKVIPWEYDKPVQLNGTKLRRCSGCAHNSETDRTLFGLEEDAKNPRGFCLNQSCYEQKQAMAQKIKEHVLKKISNRKVQTPEAIRKAAPDWVKDSSVVGFVKRQLEKAKGSPGKQREEKRRGNAGHGGRELTPHEQALAEFSGQFTQWSRDALDAVLVGVNSEPHYKIAWTLLLAVDEFWEHPTWDIPHPSVYGQPLSEMPTFPPLDETLRDAIDTAFAGSRKQIAELVNRYTISSPDYRGGFGIPHPEAIQRIARYVKVELNDPPTWTAVASVDVPESEGTVEMTPDDPRGSEIDDPADELAGVA